MDSQSQPHVAIVAASLDILGGQGVQAQSLVDCLQHDGYPVTFLPINPSFPSGLGWLRRVKYLRTVANQAVYVPQLARLASADVAHVFSASYTSFLLAPVPAMMTARLLQKRVVLHYHSGEADDHLANWGALVHPWLKLADEIVVPSQYLADVFNRHGYRARVIPNVIDLSRFHYRERRSLRPRLVSTRNLERYYRVDVILRAFAKLKASRPDAALVVAGYGSEEARLRELASEGVRFVGKVEPAVMPALLDEADIFLNTSEVDNQPVSILEAFASGLPVVTTPTGDIAAMVRHNETGLIVPPDDPEALAAAVDELLCHPERAREMAARAHQSVKRYTWPAVRDNWHSVYVNGTDRQGADGDEGRLRTLRRVWSMPLPEVATRGRQEASKWLDRVTAAVQTTPPHALLARRAPQLARPEGALAFLRETAPQRFFAGVGDARTLHTLLMRLPDHRRDVLAAAEALLARRFDFLGYRDLSFGDPIDWHKDPVNNRCAPLRHWSRLDPLDATTVGDSKVVWELNRHQWLVTLAQAYAFTGDERYALAAVTTIDDWLAANPPGIGINWASSLEVAYRLIAWSWVLMLLRESAVVSGEWLVRVLASIHRHAEHVRRYLSHYFSPNTHLTGEALGLLYAGTVFAEMRDAPRWRDAALAVLTDESRKQISRDGVHFEQSTCYHRYTLDIYLHYLLLAEKNGIAVPAETVKRAEQMADFLLAVRRPDGSMPDIGDNDGGTLLPLAPGAASNCAGLFGLAAALFKRSDFAWAAGPLCADVLWMMGQAAAERLDTLHATAPATAASKVFPSGGYAVMRSDWQPTAHQMLIDIGPLGCSVSGAHGHADLLSLQCSVGGAPCLVDAGTYGYTADAGWRDFFRSTAAHSTVIVDGRSQAECAGPFKWHRRPAARLRIWHTNESMDYLDAEHDAYATSGEPIRHRRRVVFVKPYYWVVIDDVTGSRAHDVQLQYQFAPLQLTLQDDGWARASTANGAALWVWAFTPGGFEAEVATGQEKPRRGWVSPAYGQRQPAPLLMYSTHAALPWRAITLLMPDVSGQGPCPGAHVAFDEHGDICGLTVAARRETVRFVERTALVTQF